SQTFARKADAEHAARKALGIVDSGGDPFPEKITLRALVHDKWVPHLRTQGKPRETTWTRYVELIDRWVLPDLGSLDVAKVGPHGAAPRFRSRTPPSTQGRSGAAPARSRYRLARPRPRVRTGGRFADQSGRVHARVRSHR